MSKGSMGVGSASIVLVFAVLCLTIFAVISLSAAMTDRDLIQTELQLVQAYYRADTLAEQIFAEIIRCENIPETILEVQLAIAEEAERTDGEEEGARRITFVCPINETKELSVEIVLRQGGYDIREWRMVDVMLWEFDEKLPVLTFE